MFRFGTFRLDPSRWKRQSLSNLDTLQEDALASPDLAPWTGTGASNDTESKDKVTCTYNARELTSNFSVHKDLYEELYGEPRANLSRRQKAFYDAWRDFLASRRRFWTSDQGSKVSLTPADPKQDSVRRQITMRVRYDMAFDFPTNPDWAPPSERWAAEWRHEHFDRVLEHEVASRLKRLNRPSMAGNARAKSERSRKTKSMIV